MMVVGSGTRFMSGISQYTHRLACAMAERHRTSVILMRGLVPRRLYPGAERVGMNVGDHGYPDNVRVYDGIDWFLLPSILGALRLMWRERPDLVTFQWWTGAVAHSYLLLVAVAHMRGAKIVFEMHEMQDTGEARIRLVPAYTRLLMKLMAPMIDGYVIHSEADRVPLCASHDVADKPVEVIRHGPFAQYRADDALRAAPADCVNLTYFGTIRPYKGLEDLIRAFDALGEPQRFWLTVVGETWEGWTYPAELIEQSPLRDRITFVNSYVTDHEAARWLAGADALVLPYRRSSASGPLHIGMSLGLPIAVSSVPALVDAASDYPGCVFFEPGDVEGLETSLHTLAAMRGERFDDPTSWTESVRKYDNLHARLLRVVPAHRNPEAVMT